MATGLSEAEEWLEKERSDMLRKTEGLGNANSTITTQKIASTTITAVMMSAIITITAYCNNSTNYRTPRRQAQR